MEIRKRQIVFLSISIILLLFLISCEKDEDRPTVFAGIYDADMLYHEFSLPVKSPRPI